MTLKIKDKNIMTLKIKGKQLFGRNCILDNFITRKFEWSIFVDKGSGSG